MNLVETGIMDLFVIEPVIFGDHRGYFLETFNKGKFKEHGLDYNFVQDNESFSRYGTLRGLHFQKNEFAQAKLVRVLFGKVLDVAVDIRKNSPTFGKHFAVELSSENKKMMIVPRGFAHGFVVLSETALFSYKCDNFYSPTHESGLAFDDASLGIDWIVPNDHLILSAKDLNNLRIEDL